MKKITLALIALCAMAFGSSTTTNLYSKTLTQTKNTNEKKSPNFKAVDIDGKTWTLDDFKGKYLYIDLWATWCPPCRKEIPYLKELVAELKGSNITILGLSLDEDKAKWETAVKAGGLAGVQLYLGPRSSFLEAFGVRSIPRFILLDPQGNIVDANMSRPSSASTLKFLKGL